MTETWQRNDKINISRILSLWLTKFFLKLLAGLEASINMALGFSRSASTWNTKRNKVGHVDTTHFEHEAMDQILRQCPVSRNPQGMTIVTDGEMAKLIEIYENANEWPNGGKRKRWTGNGQVLRPTRDPPLPVRQAPLQKMRKKRSLLRERKSSTQSAHSSELRTRTAASNAVRAVTLNTTAKPRDQMTSRTPSISSATSSPRRG